MIQVLPSSMLIRDIVQKIHQEAKTRRDKDWRIMSKNGKSHYRYKLHTIMNTDYALIRRMETTVNVHDSQVDLSEEGEVIY